MSSSLLEIAERVVGWAGAGFDVEAFVAQEQETEVRAYQGEVESLTAATSVGIGVRVVHDGRQGFAYAAALDDETLRETFDEALDNSRFGSVPPTTRWRWPWSSNGSPWPRIRV